MQIGELGRRAGVAAKTIRHYEEIRLLEEPARSANGDRDYGHEAVDRLRFIRDAQATGLSLSEIASIIEMRDHGEHTCGHVIEILERHLDDIDRQVRQLQRLPATVIDSAARRLSASWRGELDRLRS